MSALLDGQLDASSTERAWGHVQGCDLCRRHVEREGWVKTELASRFAAPDDGEPPQQLLGSLYGLCQDTSLPPQHRDRRVDAGAAAWAAVGELERRGRAGRRTGLAVAGAGSVSVAVLGLASLTGATLGIGGPAVNAPGAALTRAPSSGSTAIVTPAPTLQARAPGGATTPSMIRSAIPSPGPGRTGGPAGLRR